MLMRMMGIEAIYPKRRTTWPGAGPERASRPGHWPDINVLMMAEKFMDPSRYAPVKLDAEPAQAPWGVSISFTDMGYYHGWNWRTMRCSMYGPIPDQPLANIAYWQMFGSAHSDGINAVFADGSVRSLTYTISNPVFQLLCRKDDGTVIDASAL